MRRRTLGREVRLTGRAVRLHAGEVLLRLCPGSDGIGFSRDDTGERFAADLDHVAAVPNCTALGLAGGPQVFFVEHVLSALAGLGYTDAEIHVTGPEIPLFDGSALPLVEALDEAGEAELDGELEPLVLSRPVRFESDGQLLEAHPAEAWSVDYTFEHPHPRIAHDALTFGLGDDYASAIAPARTFATDQEIRTLMAAGLVKGGSEENILVVYDDRFSAPMRLEHEFAAHKILDLIGDLALLGRPLQASIVARRTGHSDNHALARAIRSIAG